MKTNPLDSNLLPSAIPPEVSLVIPVYNEEACIEETLGEILNVLRQFSFYTEVLLVNDGSTDRTEELARAFQSQYAGLRIFRLPQNCGQSAAFGVGFQNSRAPVIVAMDGDGQNNPRDIPLLVKALADCDVACGFRVERRDVWSKRIASRCANRIRRRFLCDGMRDTGCSLKALRTEWAEKLPMEFRGMHRFLPALLKMRGARVREVAVQHRPRVGGKSKYDNWRRLREATADLCAVHWMQRRYRPLNALGITDAP